MSWLWGQAQAVADAYGADPRIYFALVLITIPPFYLAFGFVIRDLVRSRGDGRRVSVSRAFKTRSFVVGLIAMGALWLVPYVYVLVWGRGLPLWFVLAFLGLMVVGGTVLYRRIRRQSACDSEDGEQR